MKASVYIFIVLLLNLSIMIESFGASDLALSLSGSGGASLADPEATPQDDNGSKGGGGIEDDPCSGTGDNDGINKIGEGTEEDPCSDRNLRERFRARFKEVKENIKERMDNRAQEREDSKGY